MIGNFRDLGGVETCDGRKVKKGIFFRASNLYNLGEEDINFIKSLNIKCIFDYRTDEEAEKYPTTRIEGIKYIRVPAFNMPIFMQKSEDTQMQTQIIEKISNNEMYDMMLKLYSSLPVCNASYKKLVELIQDPNQLGFLSQCTSGKDRTGVGTAIIYMILGVDRETIMKDYLESNNYAKIQIEDMKNKFPDLKGVPYEYINNMMGVNANYLLRVYNIIDSKYKSVEEYLYEEFELTSDKLYNIRSYCLE